MCSSDLEGVGENQDVLAWNESVETLQGLVEEGGGSEEVEQLLRLGVSAERPEASPAAARQDQSKGV